LLTTDTLYGGKLIVLQEKDGYRFSLDAILLAGLTKVQSEHRIVELGTGSGVVLLILAYLNKGNSLVGLEIQPELARVAANNVQANGFSNKIDVIQADFRSVAALFPPGNFDFVISNPPYRRLGSGRINPQPQRAIARHELAASISDVFLAGKHLLSSGGRLAVIYPSSRLDHLLVVARDHGFAPKELTVIYSTPSAPGCLVHLECHKGGGEELRIAPPFHIYRKDGSYSEAMERMFDDGRSIL
jgi:tRNA1Val (adenine37-N6)-methyltransferase